MNNVNNSTKRNIILNTIKDSMNCSMIFNKTSFLMISGAWAMHEREKLYLIHPKYHVPQTFIASYHFKAKKVLFEKSLCLKIAIQLVRMMNVITEKKKKNNLPEKRFILRRQWCRILKSVASTPNMLADNSLQ